MDVAISKHFQIRNLMSDVAKTVLTKETLVPLSLAISFVVMVASGIVSHTTNTNKLEMLTNRQIEIRSELGKMEAKFISKEMFNERFVRLEENISEIKELLRK